MSYLTGMNMKATDRIVIATVAVISPLIDTFMNIDV